MTPFYHPTFGIKFYPLGSEPPPGWYLNGIEAERMRHVEVPALLMAPSNPIPAFDHVQPENLNTDERLELVRRAHAAGVKIDGRWKLKRLKREVEKAEKKSDNRA